MPQKIGGFYEVDANALTVKRENTEWSLVHGKIISLMIH